MKRALVLSVLLAGCSPDMTATEYGALLFHDPGFAGSKFNTWSCHTCHATRAGDARILSGAPMAGVVGRGGWFGGKSQGLFDAVQTCYVSFMRGSDLDQDSGHARALYEYLASLEGPTGEVLPFTVVGNVADVARGEPDRGGAIYERACKDCHGNLHTGDGRNSSRASLLPEVTAEYANLFPGVPPSVVVVEKVRHGQFFGVGGNMPLYSTEALSDEELGAVLSYLGL